MNSRAFNSTWLREELLHLLSLSGTLAGFSVTAVTLLRTIGQPSLMQTVADDVLATGGTLLAAHGLARQLQAQVVGASVLIELGFLGGRARWDSDTPLHAALVI